jgi:hypothetical protein
LRSKRRPSPAHCRVGPLALVTAAQKNRYGAPMMLQHVKSGAFVAVCDTAAHYDTECRGLRLDPKGSRFRPKGAPLRKPCAPLSGRRRSPEFPVLSLGCLARRCSSSCRASRRRAKAASCTTPTPSSSSPASSAATSSTCPWCLGARARLSPPAQLKSRAALVPLPLLAPLCPGAVSAQYGAGRPECGVAQVPPDR